MFCRYCGKEIEDDANFCKYCGKDQGNGSDRETGNNTGNARASYQQSQYERLNKSETAQMKKVLAEKFNIGPDSEVIMMTRFHAAERFAASILLIIMGVFLIVMSLIVSVSFHSPWVVYVISWILLIAAFVYFIRCTRLITRSVFAVTDTQLLINTWRPAQKLVIPLDQIDNMNMNIVPYYRNEYGDMDLESNGKKYFFHHIYRPNEFKDALTDQMNKVKQ